MMNEIFVKSLINNVNRAKMTLAFLEVRAYLIFKDFYSTIQNNLASRISADSKFY